jgi:hypothetical protein
MIYLHFASTVSDQKWNDEVVQVKTIDMVDDNSNDSINRPDCSPLHAMTK